MTIRINKSMKNRCNSAVSTAGSLTQRSHSVLSPQAPAKKKYRRSAVSRTVRVPNELVSRVNALIAAYRERLRDDPDTWTRS